MIESSHSSVPNNIPVGSGRLIGHSLWAHRQREEASRGSLHSEASSYDSSDSDDLVTRHLRDHVQYTPPAELRRNYETLLLMIQSGPSQTTMRDPPQRSMMGEPAPGPSRLPEASYKDPVHELLDDLDVRREDLYRYLFQ